LLYETTIMKRITLPFFIAFTVTCFAQSEHWQFEDSLAGNGTTRLEIYTAPGKYAAVSTFGDQVSRTVVDSAIRQRLDLFESREGRYFVRTMFEAPLSSSFRSDATAEEVANMEAMEEMRPQVGREGLDFRLLPEKKKLFGLTVQRVELFAPDPANENLRIQLGNGWLLIGKTVPTMQCQVLSDGRTGVIVESVMHHGPDMHHQRLVGYSSGKNAPQGTFSLTVPSGYDDLNKMVKQESEPVSGPVKSVIIEEK
jgi:hypothetical protein